MKAQELEVEMIRLEVKTREVISTLVKEQGGNIEFIAEDDERWDEVEDFEDLNLPVVQGYSSNYDKASWYYITSVTNSSVNSTGVVCYGISIDGPLSADCITRLDDVAVRGMIEIIEYIENINNEDSNEV